MNKQYIDYFIFIFIVSLFLGLSSFIDAMLKKYKEDLQEKWRQKGKIYPFQTFARRWIIFATLLILAIDIFLFVCSLNPRSGITLQVGIGIPLILMPFLLICIYLFLQNIGFVVLSKDSIILHRLWYIKQIPFSEITDIKEYGLGLNPKLIIKSPKSSFKIPSNLENYFEFYFIILENFFIKKIPEFPYTLKISSKTYWFTVGEILILLIFYMGIGLLGFWIPFFAGGKFHFLAFLIIFLLTSFLFIPAIILVVFVSIKRKQPCELILKVDNIHFRFPFNRNIYKKPVNELKGIFLNHRSNLMSFKGLNSTTYDYELVLNFEPDQRIVIDQERARQFGFSIVYLYWMLLKLYKISGK